MVILSVNITYTSPSIVPTLPQMSMAHSLHSSWAARHKLHLIYKWLDSTKAHLESENNFGFDLSVKTTVLTCLLKGYKDVLIISISVPPPPKKNEEGKNKWEGKLIRYDFTAFCYYALKQKFINL